MDFCPDCKTKMMPLKKKQAKTVTLILSCPKCGYEKKVTRPNSFLANVKNRPRENLVIIGKKEQRFRTAPIFAIGCPKCGNNRAYGWFILVVWNNLQRSFIDVPNAIIPTGILVKSIFYMEEKS